MGWTKQVSKRSGKVYYFNTDTGESTYTKPPSCKEKQVSKPPTLPKTKSAASPAPLTQYSSSATAASGRSSNLSAPSQQGRKPPAKGVFSSLLAKVKKYAARPGAGGSSSYLSSIEIDKYRRLEEQERGKKVVRDWRDKAKAVCDDLLSSDSRTFHRFTGEHVTLDLIRLVIHDAAESAGLMCYSVGEGDERVVLVYKEEHPPPEIVEAEAEEAREQAALESHVKAQAAAMAEAAKNRAPAPRAQKKGAPPDPSERRLVGGMKRDRRSVAEIQEELAAEQKRRRVDGVA